MKAAATTKANPASGIRTFGDSLKAVLAEAQQLHYRQPTWVEFFRAILGPSGVARKEFNDEEEWGMFLQSEVRAEIEAMVAQLRGSRATQDIEPDKIITVRLPKCMHDALKDEAHGKRMSLNKLCVAKLLRPLAPLER
jgi:predicted HicB family RNase H-like nuclease